MMMGVSPPPPPRIDCPEYMYMYIYMEKKASQNEEKGVTKRGI
jgi:hypothetical protein